jgi:hypothetical protein
MFGSSSHPILQASEQGSQATSGTRTSCTPCSTRQGSGRVNTPSSSSRKAAKAPASSGCSRAMTILRSPSASMAPPHRQSATFRLAFARPVPAVLGIIILVDHATDFGLVLSLVVEFSSCINRLCSADTKPNTSSDSCCTSFLRSDTLRCSITIATISIKQTAVSTLWANHRSEQLA